MDFQLLTKMIATHRKKVLLFVSLMLCFAVSQAQRSHRLFGLVRDNLTQEVLADVHVYIYSDTTLISEGVTDMRFCITGDGEHGLWYGAVPREGGTFRFVFRKDGYDDVVRTEKVKPFRKSQNLRFAFNTEMQRTHREYALGEATVRATQVKFYYKGDTVVYNADAFNLAEGSMLDNLIKELPGAELSDDGEITIDGRHVEALLLNGEDFFKGNNRIMLENLPAYMVKNVQAYEKVNDRDKAIGNKKGDFVLDVHIKRQYVLSWIGNVEAGLGSDNRYLARLFAMRLTKASRLTFYGNLNNLNDTRKPGERGNWTPLTMPVGLIAHKSAGFDYLVKPKNTLHKLSGNVDVKYEDADNYSETTRENFLTQGNTFVRSRQKSRNKNLGVSTRHNFNYTARDGISGITVTPSFRYTHYDRRSSYLGATFAASPFDYAASRALFDSIQNMQGDNLRRMMLNRVMQENSADGWQRYMAFGLNPIVGIRNGFVALLASFSYSAAKDNTFSQYGISYPADGNRPSSFQNIYTHQKPNTYLTYSLSPLYSKNLGEIGHSRHFIKVRPIVGQYITRRDHSRYDLASLADWGEGTSHTVGSLPSAVDYELQTIDIYNSYNLREFDNYFGFDTEYELYYQPEQKDKGNFSLWAIFGAKRHRFRLDYTRGDYAGITRNVAILLNSQINATYSWAAGKKQLRLDYSLSETAPNMMQLIDIVDNSDPLRIFGGNPDLGKSSKHSASLLYTAKNTQKQTSLSAKMAYDIEADDIAYAYTYDRQTGVRHYMPTNINGNYDLTGSISYTTPLDKFKKLTFQTQTTGLLRHGVDMVSDDVTIAPMRSSVYRWWGSETVRLTYKIGKHSIGFKGSLDVSHVNSSREDFESFNIYNFNYGLTALVRLPWAMEISTDLTMYSHRGYTTASSNTNDLVWNARIAKSVPKWGLTFMLDGFDILNQLSNVVNSINSQGRTETYRTSLPRYVMAHVVWHLGSKKK